MNHPVFTNWLPDTQNNFTNSFPLYNGQDFSSRHFTLIETSLQRSPIYNDQLILPKVASVEIEVQL